MDRVGKTGDQAGRDPGPGRESGESWGDLSHGNLSYGDSAYGDSPSRDEHAVMDHVTGLTPILARPESGYPASEDRLIVGELVAMRSMLKGMAITPPPLKLKFHDVLKAAGRKPASTRDNRIIYWLTSHWGLGFVTAASVALAVISGWAATSNPQSKTTLASPQTEPPIAQQSQVRRVGGDSPLLAGTPAVRQGRISLRHDHPADVQAQVTALVTMLGGAVTFLTRQDESSATDTPFATIEMTVSVPADKYQLLTRQVTEFGTVESHRETAEDARNPAASLQARLTEAQEYLKRFDALPISHADFDALQRHERARREITLEIEQYRAALDLHESQTATATLNLEISQPVASAQDDSWQHAVNQGLRGLEFTGKRLLTAGIAGAPVLGVGALSLCGLRRLRRKKAA